MDWGTSVRCGGSSSPLPRFAKLPESCWLWTRRTPSVCSKVLAASKTVFCKVLFCRWFNIHISDFSVVSRIPRQWGLLSSCNVLYVDVLTLVKVRCANVIVQVMPCSDVWWGSVCWTRVRWNLITSWASKSRTSWRGGCRLRSSSWDLPRASTMPVSSSARGTFGKRWGSSMQTNTTT